MRASQWTGMGALYPRREEENYSFPILVYLEETDWKHLWRGGCFSQYLKDSPIFNLMRVVWWVNSGLWSKLFFDIYPSSYSEHHAKYVFLEAVSLHGKSPSPLYCGVVDIVVCFFCVLSCILPLLNGSIHAHILIRMCMYNLVCLLEKQNMNSWLAKPLRRPFLILLTAIYFYQLIATKYFICCIYIFWLIKDFICCICIDWVSSKHMN